MKLILVRHGQSEWNKLNLFTGWEDVALSEQGIEEAKAAGKRLADHGLHFDMVYTSVLKRAIHTAYYVMNEGDLNWVPMVKDWRLNERHYGALQGLNKQETAEKYGDEKVKIWRRSYDVRPPMMDENDPHAPKNQVRYQTLGMDAKLPLHESLKDTQARTMACYEDVIVPMLKEGKDILVAAHGNSLRSLIKVLDGLSDEAVVSLELATGIPVVYELNDQLEVINKTILD